MTRTRFAGFLAPLFFVNGLCSPIDPPPPVAGAAPQLPEVTVVAPRPAEPQEYAGENVPIFVNSHGKASERSGELSRWNTPLCPSTQGLSKGFDDFVSARVRAVANAVHLPRQTSDHCKPNALIVFTTEPQKFLDDVASKNSKLLGFHYYSQTQKVKAINRPIQAWYVTGTQVGIDTYLDDVWNPTPAPKLGSRIGTQMSTYIFFTLVVVDTTKVVGYPIGPIADYVAMMTLSQTRLVDSCGRLPSILDLMAPECKSLSDSITAGDMAYLKALYAIDMRRDVVLERAAIENRMMQEFQGR
jgi:hypothetical protein